MYMNMYAYINMCKRARLSTVCAAIQYRPRDFVQESSLVRSLTHTLYLLAIYLRTNRI